MVLKHTIEENVIFRQGLKVSLCARRLWTVARRSKRYYGLSGSTFKSPKLIIIVSMVPSSEVQEQLNFVLC